MTEPIYYHFTSDTLRDGKPIPHKDVWLKFDGEIVPCPSQEDLERGAGGLHASPDPFGNYILDSREGIKYY